MSIRRQQQHSVFAIALGRRIKAVRTETGLSRADVQKRSGGQFKTSVLAAYELGNRSMTVCSLAEIAALYDRDPADLLPTRAVLDAISGSQS